MSEGSIRAALAAEIQSRQDNSSNRQNLRKSPWKFKDQVLESIYKTEYIDSAYDRTRPAAQIFFLCTWPSKIYYFISLYFTERKAEELLIAFARLFFLAIFTTIFTLNFQAETRRRAGRLFIWISRLVFLPMYLYQLTGIPVFYTELLSAQVRLSALANKECLKAKNDRLL
jgi:hypothetical protein